MRAGPNGIKETIDGDISNEAHWESKLKWEIKEGNSDEHNAIME